MSNQSDNAIPQSQTTRKNWVDWIRALAMLFVIYGHCFPEHLTSFVYSFNVAVFFFISGYLMKFATKDDHFWKKLFITLTVPYLILATVKALPHIFSAHGGTTALAILTGFHSIGDIAGCNKLWFVYTLILVKIIVHLFGQSGKSRCILLLLSIVGAIVYNILHIDIAWSVTNMFLAMPFFLFGGVCRTSDIFNNICNIITRLSNYQTVMIVVVLVLIAYVISFYNDTAYLYRALYGHNILLFALSAVAGISFLLIVSLRLDKVKSKAVILIANGNIVILTFHQEINHALLKIIYKQEWGSILTDFSTFIVSILTLLAFVPIILVLKRYCPILIGMRRAA